MSQIDDLRSIYHQQLCQHVLFYKDKNKPSIADISNKRSVDIARSIFEQLNHPIPTGPSAGQTAGMNFEQINKNFIEAAFSLLNHLRPGHWIFRVQGPITDFSQYKHLAEIADLTKRYRELEIVFGDYLVTPDIVIARVPVTDEEINRNSSLVEKDRKPCLTPFRASNFEAATPILHASISCKLTIRSDRSQNARTEGLNLIRNRKGHTPHIAVITAEPLPSRISSLAFGTGDIDCIYHSTLHELIIAVNSFGDDTAKDLLNSLISGKRLRDIADLPFDLAI